MNQSHNSNILFKSLVAHVIHHLIIRIQSKLLIRYCHAETEYGPFVLHFETCWNFDTIALFISVEERVSVLFGTVSWFWIELWIHWNELSSHFIFCQLLIPCSSLKIGKDIQKCLWKVWWKVSRKLYRIS